MLVFLFFIDKRWLLRPMPYETCCGLSAYKYILYFNFCFFVYSLFHCVFSLTGRESKIFGFLVRKKRGKFSKEEGTNHPQIKLWYRGKEMLIKKVFHLTHKENIGETMEVLRKPGRPLLPL